MASITKFKLILLYAFCHYISEPVYQQPSKFSSHLAEALLYHQLPPAPAPALISRYSRQPRQPANNSSSDSPYYRDTAQSQTIHPAQNHFGRDNRHQQQQQQQQEQSQISFLTSRDSVTDEFPEDPYGCPGECQCNKVAQTADCSNRNLSRVPVSFPKDIKRIRLERNNITEIGPYAFQGLKRLQRIDLSNNNLFKIDALAFSGGLQTLNSLILYSNKLEHLPENVFSELSQLQLLLLNANSLQTIHKDLFQALTNLNLLSLYDNNIATLPSGTFDGLRSIKTIHLGKNPLNCDCNLRWLADYFESNPVETSEARCETSARTQGRKLRQLSRSEFKCQEPQLSKPVILQHPVTQQPPNGEQNSCPPGCVCNGVTVDCSRAPSPMSESQAGGGTFELPDVPDDVPVYVARVHINDNRIKRIRQTGLFRRLANSQKLDLGNSKIIDIEDNAINGQFSNGQKPERVVFVLLENQNCGATQSAPQASSQQQQQSTPSTFQTKSNRAGNREQQQVAEDPCIAAPKVNEPQFDSACYNGGVCKSSAQSYYANYSCLCPAGFAGPLCEINIDECVDHQCQNGAMCVDGINSYKCICRDPTTTGEFCEQINPLAGSPNYAASSANSIAPIALPIIAGSGASLISYVPGSGSGSAYEISTPVSTSGSGPLAQGSQIIARSADNLRAPDDLASNSLTGSSSVFNPTIDSQQECHRITQRKYFDDGNGCQSVRVLKISECAGSCGGQGASSGCCLPAKVKRRRIRMQCSDGASYVKTVDLIKKCACSNDSSCPARDMATVLTTLPATSTLALPMSKPHKGQHADNYYKYLAQQKPQQTGTRQAAAPLSASQVDQMLQITRLDAVD